MNDEALEKEFLHATEFRDAGRYDEALDALNKLRGQLESSAAYWAVVGHVLWKLQRRKEATEAFRRSTGIAPKYEPPSLGLFHCLLEMKKTREAFDEMRRFLSLSESEEYRRLMKDINDEWTTKLGK